MSTSGRQVVVALAVMAAVLGTEATAWAHGPDEGGSNAIEGGLTLLVGSVILTPLIGFAIADACQFSADGELSNGLAFVQLIAGGLEMALTAPAVFDGDAQRDHAYYGVAIAGLVLSSALVAIAAWQILTPERPERTASGRPIPRAY